MRGISYKLLLTTLASMAVAALFAVAVTSVLSGMIQTKVIEKTTAGKMSAESAAYLVENCFTGKEGFISSDFLDKNKDKTVCQIEACKLCTKDIRVKAEDREKEKTWDFGYRDSEFKRNITVTILDERTGYIHVGVLYVSILS